MGFSTVENDGFSNCILQRRANSASLYSLMKFIQP